jgi:hypothetical protein
MSGLLGMAFLRAPAVERGHAKHKHGGTPA